VEEPTFSSMNRQPNRKNLLPEVLSRLAPDR
jgi:hypothetical protein